MAQNHGRNTDFFINGYNLTPYLQQAAWQGQRDMADGTVFKMNSKQFVPGMTNVTMTASGFADSVVTAEDPILYAALTATTKGLLTYYPRAADAMGARSVSMDFFQSDYQISSDVGGISTISAAFGAAGDGVGPDEGYVIHPNIAEAGAGTSVGSVDYGAVSTTNGGYLSVQANAATSLVVFLQDSADNSTFADVASGSINMGSVQGAARLFVPGTIRRYTRARWTGSGTFIAQFGRS